MAKVIYGYHLPCGGMDELSRFPCEGAADSGQDIQASIPRGQATYPRARRFKGSTRAALICLVEVDPTPGGDPGARRDRTESTGVRSARSGNEPCGFSGGRTRRETRKSPALCQRQRR